MGPANPGGGPKPSSPSCLQMAVHTRGKQIPRKAPVPFVRMFKVYSDTNSDVHKESNSQRARAPNPALPASPSPAVVVAPAPQAPALQRSCWPATRNLKSTSREREKNRKHDPSRNSQPNVPAAAPSLGSQLLCRPGHVKR